MRDLLLFGLLLVFLAAGASAPFVFGLGYVWVDMFLPQRVSYGFVAGLPMSLLMAAGAFVGWLMIDRRDRPDFWAGIWIFPVWAAWCTLTTTWAEVPLHAWVKWDWAIKTILFAGFMPYLFRTQVQIEAVTLVMVLSIAGHMIPFGLKTLIGGGGYLKSLGLLSDNTGLAGETSALATVCAALIPTILYAGRFGILLPRSRAVRAGMVFLLAMAVLTVLGTYARTGLVALAVLAAAWWIQSQRKVAFILVALGMAAAGWTIAGDRWADRMSTITQYQGEVSALNRVVVWKWTYDYATRNPLGGGFDVYRINLFRIPLQSAPGGILEIRGRAFHSIYFEVLGEHGFVGLGLFLLLNLIGIRHFAFVIRTTAGDAQLLWARELAKALLTAQLVFLAGGAFVGVAFQPFIYYMAACAIALQQAVLRHRQAVAPAAAPALRPQSAH